MKVPVHTRQKIRQRWVKCSAHNVAGEFVGGKRFGGSVMICIDGCNETRGRAVTVESPQPDIEKASSGEITARRVKRDGVRVVVEC
jgi:hypothetical protein